jgi:hypothetical protein
MPQKRGTATDHVNNVLQVLELGRKSGHLYVERGEGERTEKGELVFHAGRIVDAHCGQHQGMAAFYWLQQWGPCRFIFNSNIVEHPTRFLPTPLHNPNLTTRQLTGVNPALDNGQRIPRRTHPADEGLAILAQSHLSRLHRQCYLLIDGQHCISELIRLLGRNALEVQQIVQDLATIGIIKY